LEEDVDEETARNTAKNAQTAVLKENKNPLLTDLDPSSKKDKRARKAEMWFDKVSSRHLLWMFIIEFRGNAFDSAINRKR